MLCIVVVMYSNDASPIHISIVIWEHWSVRGWSWVGLLVWDSNLSSYKVSVHKLWTGCHDSRSKLHQRSFLPVCVCGLSEYFLHSKAELDFSFAFSALLVGQQEGHQTCKNWVVRYWHGYLSGAKCIWHRWCHPPHLLLLQYNPERFTFLVLAYPGCPGKKAIKWM